MYFVHPQIKFKDLLGYPVSNSSFRVDDIQNIFPGKQLVFTDMGRSAFKIIVEKLNLQNSEIIMPAYICDIFGSILEKYNIQPVFADINLATFHIETKEIINKLTPRTKAVLVCHTYGLPFDVDGLKSELRRRPDIAIIEDCAHAFGIKPQSDTAFFSLYKQFPSLRGGLLVCPKDWEVSLPETSFNLRDFISLLNCLPFFAFLFKRFGNKEIAQKMIRKEKLQRPAGINKISLNLFLSASGGFEKTLERRKKTALFFQDELKKLGFDVQDSRGNVFCYLSVLVPKPLEDRRDEIVKRLRKYHIFCTRIWHTPFVLDKAAFPNTYEAAKRIINFPLQNDYAEGDIKKITTAVKKVLCEF